MIYNYENLTDAVEAWATERGIIANSTPLAQAIKTTEEVAELLKALSKNNIHEAADAYGDILVTLIIGAKISGLNLENCLAAAYNVIKDRKGYLTPDGIFVKVE